jgi:cytochrome P450
MSVEDIATGQHQVVPPYPEPPPADLSAFQLVSAMRTDGLSGWPRRAYEETIVQRRFFHRNSFILNEPDAIRHVLVDHDEKYSRTAATIRVLRPLLGEGLFLSEGQMWRRQRRTLAPAFTPKAIDLLVPHILSATSEAIAGLSRVDQEPVDLFTVLQHLALEIAGRTMFSLEMRRHGPALREFLIRYNRRLGRPYLLDLLLPVRWPTPHDITRAWFRRGWVRFIDQLMAERRQSGGSDHPRDLLDLLGEARDPDTGEAFTSTQLRDQVATMILAGHVTTAVALFWSVYLLALAPEVQDRVADEVAREGDEDNAAPAPGRLVLTRAVIDEAMRLYPPAFVIVRAARALDNVAERQVAPGDVVVVSPWILHRHRQLWREPNAFDPGRFLPGAPPVPRYAYLPFGVGPRVCIGAHFALTEAQLVLARLIGAFRIELASTRPVLPVAVVTTQPDHAPLFHLSARSVCKRSDTWLSSPQA